jgi:hypothetical protein
MHANSILFVRRAERNGRDDRARGRIWIRTDVHGTGSETVYVVFLDTVCV